MTKTWLAAAAALAMMTGGAVAQTSSSSTISTQSTTSAPVSIPGSVSTSSSQHSTDSNGVVTDKTQTYANGTSVTPSGDLAATRKSTETTTTRQP